MFDQRGGDVSRPALPRSLTRREFLVAGAGLFEVGLGRACRREAEAALLGLDLFARGYPHAFFFRQAGADAASGQFSYEEWEKRYLSLDVIVGKVPNEEQDYAEEISLEWFLRYKECNPSNMVNLRTKSPVDGLGITKVEAYEKGPTSSPSLAL